MKTLVLHSTLFALIGLVFSPLAMAHASSPPADGVHFCAFDDYEQWRRDHPRPAAKRLADLNVGKPRTVRLIYSLPNDRPFREEVVDSMKTVIGQVQTFYAEQMQAHGYGDMTFDIETDAQGEPLVHRVDGQHPASHYDNTYGAAMVDETMQAFDLDANIYLIVIDNGKDGVGDSAGRGTRRGKNGGYAWVAGNFGWKLVVHELGHAFGLQHDFRDGAYIMSYGPGWDGLSACAAEFLAVHPYFNPDSPIGEGQPPTIELVSPTGYPAGSQSVSIQLKVSDPEGVHQVVLFVPGFATIEVKACRGVSNKKDAVVEFEYDGVIPSDAGTSLSNPIAHAIVVEAVDTDGNVRREQYGLAEISPYYIATLEGHTDLVRSVAFSPDGTLASGSWDGTAKLWNTKTRKQIATFSQGRRTDTRVVSVAFSPNGEILAVVSSELGLWDVATKQQIFTHRGEGHPYSVAFSPDGTLAIGLWNGTVELLDVGTKRQIATLKGHTNWVRSVAFSQDGTLLASGSNDGMIRLWDVMAREQIATLKGYTNWVRSVAFSPNGTMLASGSGDRTVKLWDVATRQNIATLEGHTHGVEAVSFLPDGTLISGDARGTILLWDVATQERIATLGQVGGVHSVAFSPDGGILASGSGVGTIGLWDMSEWAGSSEQEITAGQQATPHSLTKISGAGQGGQAGTTLAKPFVVSVLDQNGSAFAGAVVSFSVTVGGGTLSTSTATTDANGRARSTLTLGSDPGANTVAATVEGLEPVTFTATAVEQTPHSLTKVSGDSQEGPASTKLAAPFVVSVLDQASSPLAGVSVTFSVTAGGGMLSSTTDANPCTIESSTSSTIATTDANGQAATRLTLGSEPGTNTVTATVAGLESVTFTATAAEQAMPHSLTKVCGDSQEGTAGILLAEPFVVLVSDEDSAAMAGVVVSFSVTAGGGTLSDTTATTDANGRAATRLTLGSEPGTNTVAATVEGLESGTFTATGQESPFVSLFDLFGGGKRVALPDSPQLAQNAPNPFNSQTILSYFLPAAGPAHLTVFTLTGQRVAVLQQGLQQAGYHRLHWDGRDDVGRPVASGLYLYRLVTDEVVLTRKLVLLR